MLLDKKVNFVVMSIFPILIYAISVNTKFLKLNMILKFMKGDGLE
jgi:hypothetical protein